MSELLALLLARSEAYVVSEASTFPNRLEFPSLEQDDDDILEFIIAGVDTVSSGGILFSRQQEDRMKQLLGVPLSPDLLHRLRLAAVAEELEADAFVTTDPILLKNRHVPILARGNTRSIEEAVALLGLFLRSRGDYIVWPDSAPMGGYGRWGFYFGLTRALLPGGWRWFSACVAGDSNSGPASPLGLGDATLRRVHRSLRCRDLVHIEAAKPDSREVAEEQLLYLDSLLVALGGAFDAVARVAHLTYGLAGPLRYASWRKEGWLTKLGTEDMSLSQLMAPKTQGRDSLELLATLRNCLHGEALGLVTVSFTGQSGRVLVRVPEREAERIRLVTQRYAPAQAFGIEELASGLALRPEVLCEVLVPWVIATLNALMEASDVARLGQPLRTGPSPDDGKRMFPSIFAEETRQRLRLLAGL